MKIEEMEVGKLYLSEYGQTVEYVGEDDVDTSLCNWFNSKKHVSQGRFDLARLSEVGQCPRILASFAAKEWITEEEWEKPMEMVVGRLYKSDEKGIVQFTNNSEYGGTSVVCNVFTNDNKFDVGHVFNSQWLTEVEDPRMLKSFADGILITEKEWEDMEKTKFIEGELVHFKFKNQDTVNHLIVEKHEEGRVHYTRLRDGQRDGEQDWGIEKNFRSVTEADSHKYKVGDRVVKDWESEYTITKLMLGGIVLTYGIIDDKGREHWTYEGLLQPTKTPDSEKLEFKVGDVVLDSKNAPTVILDVEEYNVWYITSIDSSRVYRAKESVNHATEADTHKYKIGDTVIGKHSGDQYVVHKLTVVNKLVSYWVNDTTNNSFASLLESSCREDSYGDFAKEAAKPQNIPVGSTSTKSYLDEIRDLENQVKILEIDNEELENSRDHFKDTADRVKTEKEELIAESCKIDDKYQQQKESRKYYYDLAVKYSDQFVEMEKTHTEEIKALKESRLFFQTLSDSYMTDNIAQTKVLVEAQKQAANWKSKSDQYESQLAINESKVDKPSLMKRVFG